MDKRTCCCQVLRMTLLEKMLHDNYMCFIYLSADLYNCKSTSLENVFSRLYLIHFTELYVWICPMILIRTSVPWTSLDILFHGLCFTWYSIQMEFTWHDMQWIYLSWYSITFTGDCFPWALLLIVFNGLTWDTPQLNFIWDCLKGTWDAIQRTLLETVFNILYMRLSLVNFVGDDVQKTAIVPTLCMYLCLCVCVSGLMYFLAHTRLHQWRRCGFHNECDEEIVKCRT